MLTQHFYKLLEEGVNDLIHHFLESPYAFYTESDLHCSLYHLLSNLGLNKDCHVNIGNHIVPSTILHKEYPTKGRYKRKHDDSSYKLKKGSRGHFDLCLWDPNVSHDRYFRRSGGVDEQRTIAAVEISLNEHHARFQWHVYWDLVKLTDSINEVDKGIILFFIRDYPYKRVKFPLDGFLRKLHEMFGSEDRIDIIYIERNIDEKIVWMISDTTFGKYKHYAL